MSKREDENQCDPLSGNFVIEYINHDGIIEAHYEFQVPIVTEGHNTVLCMEEA
jgi:hypothetical protein